MTTFRYNPDRGLLRAHGGRPGCRPGAGQRLYARDHRLEGAVPGRRAHHARRAHPARGAAIGRGHSVPGQHPAARHAPPLWRRPCRVSARSAAMWPGSCSPGSSSSAFGSQLRPPARTPSFTRPSSSSRHCWPSTSASPGTAEERRALHRRPEITTATCARPPWTAVTPSNRAGRHRAARHGRRWADPAGRRHRTARPAFSEPRSHSGEGGQGRSRTAVVQWPAFASGRGRIGKGQVAD